MSDSAWSEISNIDLFHKITTRKTSDVIIEHIQNLISSGKLRPGTRLPSERALADQLRVGRGPLREALKKLEFYGIVQTMPHRGTVVADLGVPALKGLIATVLNFTRHNVRALLETRAVLEVEAARLAARAGSSAQTAKIDGAQALFESRLDAGSLALEEDHLFHLAIADATGNPVLASLIGLLTPDIIATNRDTSSSEQLQNRELTRREHRAIVDAIRSGDPDGAVTAMKEHMDGALLRRLGPIDEKENQ